MREIIGISCLLLGVAMLSCQVESGAGAGSTTPPLGRELEAEQQAAVRWVRTVDGWERSDIWNMEVTEEPTLHPLVVAAGQGLMSVFGLVAFSREER